MIDKIKTKIKKFWENKTKRYILIGILALILLLIIIIIIVVCVKKSNSSKEKPDLEGICSKSYDIQVYKEEKIISSLKECGYDEKSNLFNFALSAIIRHNLYRACHNAKPLLPNCDLMKISQDYSNKMIYSHSGNDYNDEWLGENIFEITNNNLNGQEIVDNWYKESKEYNFNKKRPKDNGKITSHFTQLVWKNSKDIGIGYTCKLNNCIVIANYFPGGNIDGEYSDNVEDRKD